MRAFKTIRRCFIMNISAASTTSTNYNFLLKNYYSKNRAAAKAVTRSKIKDDILVTADSSALQKISKALRDLEYSTDNGTDIYNNLKAFTEAYNNLTDSTSNSASYDISHPKKLLKNLIKEKKDELEDLGITISASGKLTIDEETLLKCSPQKISKVFSADSDFTQKIRNYSKKIYKASNYLNLTTPQDLNLSNSNNNPSTKSIFDAKA